VVLSINNGAFCGLQNRAGSQVSVLVADAMPGWPWRFPESPFLDLD
jgi:hypothetical protein